MAGAGVIGPLLMGGLFTVGAISIQEGYKILKEDVIKPTLESFKPQQIEDGVNMNDEDLQEYFEMMSRENPNVSKLEKLNN